MCKGMEKGMVKSLVRLKHGRLESGRRDWTSSTGKDGNDLTRAVVLKVKKKKRI